MTIKKLSKNKVCAIVVTYKTNLFDFKKNLHQLQKNYHHILLINNDLDQNLQRFISNKVTLINNSKNLGLAVALNDGIKKAESMRFQRVALFDQDSFIPDDFDQIMQKNINDFHSKFPGAKIASYSSIFLNKQSNVISKVITISFLSFKVRNFSINKTYDYTDWVITSGSYLDMDTFKKIGLYDENLFIDYVDIEWCLRARKKGHRCLTFNNTYFTHDLGNGFYKVFDRHLYIHSPLRLYYSIRNSLYLPRLKHISLNFFITDQVRNLLKLMVFLLWDPKNAPKRLRFTFKAIGHAMMSKMGKLEE